MWKRVNFQDTQSCVVEIRSASLCVENLAIGPKEDVSHFHLLISTLAEETAWVGNYVQVMVLLLLLYAKSYDMYRVADAV